MKKISRMFVCILMLCMTFSTVAFAAESEMSVKKVDNIQHDCLDKVEKVEAVRREPAPPITSATIINILQDTDTGNVYVLVEVAGYGSTFGYLDGSRVPLYKTENIGSPVVTGFVYWFDCGVLSSGTYTFRYSGTSYNKPWNTVNQEITFTVP